MISGHSSAVPARQTPLLFLEGVPVGRGSNMSIRVPCDSRRYDGRREYPYPGLRPPLPKGRGIGLRPLLPAVAKKNESKTLRVAPYDSFLPVYQNMRKLNPSLSFAMWLCHYQIERCGRLTGRNMQQRHRLTQSDMSQLTVAMHGPLRLPARNRSSQLPRSRKARKNNLPPV